MERKEITLPDSLMAAIKAVTADETVPTAERFEAVVLITYGYALWDRQEGPIDGTRVVIPHQQWLDIAQMVTDLGRYDVDRVNYGLSWMNIGPSARDNGAKEQ